MKKIILNEKNIRKIIRQVLKEVDSRIDTSYGTATVSRTSKSSQVYTEEDKKFIEEKKKAQTVNTISHDSDNNTIIVGGKFEYQPGETIKKISINTKSKSILGDDKKIFENIDNIKAKDSLLTALSFIEIVITNLDGKGKEDEKKRKSFNEAIGILEEKKKTIEINLSKLQGSKYIFKLSENPPIQTVFWSEEKESYYLKAFDKNKPEKSITWKIAGEEGDFKNFPDNLLLIDPKPDFDEDIKLLIKANKETIKKDIGDVKLVRGLVKARSTPSKK